MPFSVKTGILRSISLREPLRKSPVKTTTLPFRSDREEALFVWFLQVGSISYREQLATLDPVSFEFTAYLRHTLVDHAEVGTDGTIMFTFRDGRSQTILLNK